MLEELLEMRRLSNRELDVVRVIAGGATNREAAAALGLQVSTLKNYLTQIYRTIGLRNRVHLILWSMDNDLTRSNRDETTPEGRTELAPHCGDSVRPHGSLAGLSPCHEMTRHD
jgi:DNA-binding CsgD family transcriptional regulator